PAALAAPCWDGVLRKPGWNGWVPRNDLRSAPALRKHGSFRLMAFMACWRVAVEHSRSAKYSHQNASGHLSLLPMATGTMCAALSLVTSAPNWVMVAGGAGMPALADRALR